MYINIRAGWPSVFLVYCFIGAAQRSLWSSVRAYVYDIYIYYTCLCRTRAVEKYTPEHARDGKQGVGGRNYSRGHCCWCWCWRGVIRKAISDASEFRRRTTSAAYVYISYLRTFLGSRFNIYVRSVWQICVGERVRSVPLYALYTRGTYFTRRSLYNILCTGLYGTHDASREIRYLFGDPIADSYKSVLIIVIVTGFLLREHVLINFSVYIYMFFKYTYLVEFTIKREKRKITIKLHYGFDVNEIYIYILYVN